MTTARRLLSEQFIDTRMRPVRAPTTVTLDPNPTLAGSAMSDGATSMASGGMVFIRPGTPKQLSAQACKRLTLTAPKDNGGVLVFGDADVQAMPPQMREGVSLFPGETVEIDIGNMNLLYVDGQYNGDVFTWNAYN